MAYNTQKMTKYILPSQFQREFHPWEKKKRHERWAAMSYRSDVKTNLQS